MGKMCCGKAAEGHGCGCGTKEMNWESYDKPSFTKTMMAESFNAEYAGGEYDDGEDYINTDHNTIYGQVNFMQITHNGTREHHNTAHCPASAPLSTPLAGDARPS